jgi:hypothetical protein
LIGAIVVVIFLTSFLIATLYKNSVKKYEQVKPILEAAKDLNTYITLLKTKLSNEQLSLAKLDNSLQNLNMLESARTVNYNNDMKEEDDEPEESSFIRQRCTIS